MGFRAFKVACHALGSRPHKLDNERDDKPAEKQSDEPPREIAYEDPDLARIATAWVNLPPAIVLLIRLNP